MIRLHLSFNLLGEPSIFGKTPHDFWRKVFETVGWTVWMTKKIGGNSENIKSLAAQGFFLVPFPARPYDDYVRFCGCRGFEGVELRNIKRLGIPWGWVMARLTGRGLPNFPGEDGKPFSWNELQTFRLGVKRADGFPIELATAEEFSWISNCLAAARFVHQDLFLDYKPVPFPKNQNRVVWCHNETVDGHRLALMKDRDDGSWKCGGNWSDGLDTPVGNDGCFRAMP